MFKKGDRIVLSERGLRRGRYSFYTRWGIEIYGVVVKTTDKSSTMQVRVDGERYAFEWHKTYWNLVV